MMPGRTGRWPSPAGSSSRRGARGHLPGPVWLLGASLVAQLVVAACALVDREQLCAKLAVSPSTILVQPGMNATLSCLEGELENSTQVYWMFNGQNLSASAGRQVVSGRSLFVSSVYFNDSGRYTCYASGRRLLCSLRLMVEEPPEAPNFTCFRKSLAKDIFCEWRTPRGMSGHTKARLWVQKNFVGVNRIEQPCRYYVKSRKFACRIGGITDDNVHILKVSVCIFNLAGALSSHSFITTDNLLKPDPPVDVEVKSVEKDPHKLLVTWRKPPSWGSSFFRLQFEIRYRADASATYNTIHLQDEHTSYTISDVMSGVLHIVQVRAREEFNQGVWSEWSREGFGVPWTEPKDPDLETTLVTSEVNYSASTAKPNCTSQLPGIMSKPAVEDAASTPLYTFLIMAVSVTGVVGVLIAGVILRYRKKWGTSPPGEEKPSAAPPHSLTLMAPEPPLSTSPLLSPPASPFSESSADSPSVLENSPYDVSNADYFLMP